MNLGVLFTGYRGIPGVLRRYTDVPWQIRKRTHGRALVKCMCTVLSAHNSM